MEIKRRLTKIGLSLSPQIEVMNVSSEMNLLLDRFEELVRYAQEKIDRSIERGKTIGAGIAEKRAAAQKIITDHQQAEADENLADQQEAFDERNKKPGAEEITPDSEVKEEEYLALPNIVSAPKEEAIVILEDEPVPEPEPCKHSRKAGGAYHVVCKHCGVRHNAG